MKPLLIVAALTASEPSLPVEYQSFEPGKAYGSLSELLQANPKCLMMADDCIKCAVGPKGLICTAPSFACMPSLSKWRCTAE